MRTLTGIQPTGSLHWGNFFGVIEPALRFSHESEGDSFFLIANLHALTAVGRRDRLHQWTFDLAIDLVALGLDPNRATLYAQSDVVEVTTLAWLLATVADVDLLESSPNYEEKKAQGMRPSAALLSYPVLMAADIAATGAERVVVGPDQQRHVEICQELFERFNRQCGEVFPSVRCEPVGLSVHVPGTDGADKMSKNMENAIDVLSEPGRVRKHLDEIAGQKGGEEILFSLHEPFASEADRQRTEEAFRQGRLAREGLTQTIAEAVDERFGKARARRRALVENPSLIENVLAMGARRVQETAREVTGRALEAAGASTSDLRRKWNRASPHASIESIPEIARLREPTRTRAAENFEELRAEGHDVSTAVERAMAMALEWEMSRAPTLAVPGSEESHPSSS